MTMSLALLTLALAGGAAGTKPTAPVEGVVPSADGVPIHYRVQGQGSPALVFVHCWACDRHYWDGQVEHFAKGHRVVTLDLGGHGRSGNGRREWTIESFGQDVEAVVTRLDLKRVILIGHSMGGPVILDAARRMPGRVVGLVPVDTLADVEDRMTPEKTDEFLAAFQTDFRAATGKFIRDWMFVPSSPPALIEAIVREASAADPTIAIPALRNTWTYDAAAALAGIKVPVVAVNADKWPTNLESARRHAPQFDAVIVPGLGHYLMRESPDRFNAALEEALRRVLASAGR